MTTFLERIKSKIGSISMKIGSIRDLYVKIVISLFIFLGVSIWLSKIAENVISKLWSHNKCLLLLIIEALILPLLISERFLKHFIKRDYLSLNFFEDKIHLSEENKKNLDGDNNDLQIDEHGYVPVKELLPNGRVRTNEKLNEKAVKKLLLSTKARGRGVVLLSLFILHVIIAVSLGLASYLDNSSLIDKNANKQKEIKELDKEILALKNKVNDKESRLKHINDLNNQGLGYYPTKFVSCNDLEAIKKYLKAGMDINVKDRDGNTALIFSSKAGWEDIVSFLLEKGANINEANNDGETALIKTVQNGNLKIFRTLLEKHKAKVNIKDKKGKTALTYAVTNNAEDISLLIVEKILKHDRAVAGVRDEQGNPPLVYAIDKGYIKIIKKFPCKSFEDENVERAVNEKGNIVIERIAANCDG